jgi:hypothetical protein
MARRRDHDEKPDALTAAELKEMSDRLAHLSPVAVQNFYEEAFEKCRMIYGRVPSPRKMQTLVAIWKVLRKWGR